VDRTGVYSRKEEGVSVYLAVEVEMEVKVEMEVEMEMEQARGAVVGPVAAKSVEGSLWTRL
jgi:hypothetical protein